MRLIVLAVLLASLLAGCTTPDHHANDLDAAHHDDRSTEADASPPDDDAEPSADPEPTDPEPDDPEPEPAGTPGDPHGEVQVQEGETTARAEDGRYVAEKRVVLTNGRGDARRIEVDLTTRYANVTVVPADVGGYTYTFDLDVRADTEALARDGMDRVTVHHDDELTGGVLALDTRVAVGHLGPLPVGVGPQPDADLSYDLRIEVPRHLAYGLHLRADYTAFASGPLAWTELDLTADYAALVFADAPGLEDLTAELDYSELALRTDPAGGDWSVRADYSEVRIDTSNDAGYDVAVQSQYSVVHILLPDMEDHGGSQRTRGYDHRAVQVDAEMELAYSTLGLS